MKLKNIRGYGSIDEFVRHKIAEYSEDEKSLGALFRHMFSEHDNVMMEETDGYRIRRTTYGECRARILAIAPTLARALAGIPADSIVGLYMANSPRWIELFWAILACGYRPLLMNTRLPDEVLERILAEHDVAAVISDGKQFAVRTLASAEVAVLSDEAPLDRPFGSEVIFMSSGTTSSVKLCAYTGENFYYQICDSAKIIANCPRIKRHYKGELKQLALLPFYHVFGFIAVYLWFGFFARTFVFPRDLNPATIQNTVKKHGVTHIFAVPMVWEAVYKAATRRIRARGARTHRRFERAVALVTHAGRMGNGLARRLLREVREGLFGDSVQFLITGGSYIDPQVLRFFNGIGYHMANGYGMTEIGITSVERSVNKRILNTASVGAPFGYTAYAVSEEGELLVKGRTMATRILQDGREYRTDFDAWFHTGDLACSRGGRYYLNGRSDDLIICENGENLNPVLAEEQLRVTGVDRLCILADRSGAPVLLASVPGCFVGERLREIHAALCDALRAAKLEGTVTRIRFTHEPLLFGNDFKISRRKLLWALESGALHVFDAERIEEHVEELISGLEREIRAAFAEALDKDAESIGTEDHFFHDLGGTSMDYFTLLGILKNRFGVELLHTEDNKLATVKDFWSYIKNC